VHDILDFQYRFNLQLSSAAARDHELGRWLHGVAVGVLMINCRSGQLLNDRDC